MLKIATAGLTALFVTASPLVYAQTPSMQTIEHLTPSDWSALTDAKIDIVRATLRLTPEQERFWPAVEDAVRAVAKDRQARIENVIARVREARERSPIEVLRDRNPIEFLQRRADVLTQRSAELKKLAAAWQPLYQTLSPDQKRRMASLTILVIREMRNELEERRLQAEEDDQG